MTREDHKTRLVELVWDLWVRKVIKDQQYRDAMQSINALTQTTTELNVKINTVNGEVRMFPVEGIG